MDSHDVLHYAIRPACEILGLSSPLAERMLLAIGYQESKLKYRRQSGVGPARGFWQFETGGVRGVRLHASTKDRLPILLERLSYSKSIPDLELKQILEHNDILAAGMARLYLFTCPQSLPQTETEGWRQYIATWRPGKPHPGSWPEAWRLAAIHEH